MVAPLSRRRALPLILALGLLGLLPGCSGRPDGGRGASRELSVWTLDLAPRFNPFMQAVIRDWERRHPGVRVRWTDVPWSSVERKLLRRSTPAPLRMW